MVDAMHDRNDVSMNTVVQEKKTLREWKDTVLLRTPNFLFNYREIVNHLEWFPPCQLAISPKADVLALMSHKRELEIYNLLEECIGVRVKALFYFSVLILSTLVLEERYPEWCLLKFTASGCLLLSTRSNSVIDVFDSSGGYCYSIASKAVESFDASLVICDMTSVSQTSETSKCLDVIYTLQYNSIFSSYELTLLDGYVSLFKVDLGQNLTTSFVLVPSINLLVVAGQYRSLKDVENIDCNAVGLNVYRIVNEEPYVVDVRATKTQISLFEIIRGWLTFNASQNGVIISLHANRCSSHLSAVSSTGDIFIFDLPSLRLRKHIVYYSSIAKPVQTIWINDEEVAFLTQRGEYIKGGIDIIEDLFLEKRSDVESFAENASIFAPTEAVVFALESTVLSSEGSRSTTENRAWLAAKLRLTTLYDYIKAYIDAAIGQPLVAVSEAVERREVLFALREIRSITLQRMIQKMLAHGDFSEALKLTRKYKFENIDFVYKEQWRQLGESATVESVDNVLARITDKSWVLSQCISSRASDIKVQHRLVYLAKEITSGQNSPSRAYVLHCERIIKLAGLLNEDEDRVIFYIGFRTQSYLDAAIYFAKEARIDVIEKHLFNDPTLRCYLLTLLWFIPGAVPPNQYSFLIPYNLDGWFKHSERKDSLSSELLLLSNDLEDIVEKLNYESPIYKRNESLLKPVSNKDAKLADIVQFLKNRCHRIDMTTGLTGFVVNFIELIVSHGFQMEMELYLEEASFYNDFVVCCGLVPFSFEQFIESTDDVVFQTIEKHLDENGICKSLARIYQLLEFLSVKGRCASITDRLKLFLCNYSKNSLRVLKETLNLRKEWINDELITACLCAYRATGKQLTHDITDINLSSKYVKALETFNKHNLYISFEKLHKSFNDVALARQLLYKFLRSAKCVNYLQWKSLKDDYMDIYLSFYSEVFEEEEVLIIFADYMLDMCDIRKGREFITLVLFANDVGNHDEIKHRLSVDASIDFLVEKSTKYFIGGTLNPDDPNLRLANDVLSLASSEYESKNKKLLMQKQLLKAFDVALQLNCTLLPVNFKLSEFESLFVDIVRVNENYKKCEKCTELAKLLNISTPMLRSLELCAAEALLQRDIKFLRSYCEKLLKTPKNIHFPDSIHSLCIEVYRSRLLKDMDDKLLTFAVLSSPAEDILDTLSLFAERDNSGIFNSELTSDSTSEIVPDPFYSTIDEYCIPVESKPLLTDNPIVHIDRYDSKAFDSSVSNLAKHYTNVSSSVALGLSLLASEETEWTDNIYSRAIRLALKELSFNEIQCLHPSYLVKKYESLVTGETALERILNSGCDRERFFEDSRYRVESLNGIAMWVLVLTANVNIIKDCIEVAEKYKVDVWEICISSLEYILSDSDAPTESLKNADCKLKLLNSLKSQKRRFYDHLRSKTIKSVLVANDHNIRIRLYLGLFEESEKEFKWLTSLNYIGNIIKDCDYALLLGQDVSKVAYSVYGYLKGDYDSLITNLLLLPNGSNICEKLAHVVFSNERNTFCHVKKCFYLLEKNPDRFLCLIRLLESEELTYLERVLDNWESNEALYSLRVVFDERLKELKDADTAANSFTFLNTFKTSSSDSCLRRRHH
uniref:Vacuolar protein sorting-associated protein 16 homolog n=1 Tax=Syphacia muris TaxID=451379 RepID=A0A158R3X9_9BILA